MRLQKSSHNLDQNRTKYDFYFIRKLILEQFTTDRTEIWDSIGMKLVLIQFLLNILSRVYFYCFPELLFQLPCVLQSVLATIYSRSSFQKILPFFFFNIALNVNWSYLAALCQGCRKKNYGFNKNCIFSFLFVSISVFVSPIF